MRVDAFMFQKDVEDIWLITSVDIRRDYSVH